MSGTIPFTLSNVSQVAVQAINASATLSAGGTGSESVFAGVVISEYGQPFEILRVTKDNWKDVLGKPYHPSLGATLAEPLRHVADAVNGGAGYVVRVVAEDAKYPALVAHVRAALAARVAKTAKAAATTEGEQEAAAPAARSVGNIEVMPTSQAFGTAAAVPDDALFAIYPKDGNVSERSVSIQPITNKPGFFTLSLFDTNAVGVEYAVEEHEVSFDLNAVDDMGTTAYIENRLQSRSTRLAITVNTEHAGLAQFAGMPKTTFKGGTLGNQKEISVDQYEKAIAVLRNALVGYTAVLGLGCYDKDVIASLASLASARRIDAFADITPSLSHAEALEFMEGMNINNHDLCMYHFPYSAKDSHSGGRAVWGISGVAFAAKAAGVAKATGAVGGWHYSPAGEERGIIDRRELEPLTGVGEPNYNSMYKARINKVGLSSSGKLMIDDAITCRGTEDYLRFQHISSVMNAISRQFYSLARQLKHSPDGVTEEGLTRGMTDVLEDFVSADALVKPRNPDDDGDQPYVLTVTQTDIDAWEVQWACCVTGSARRILGTPSLIR